MPLCTQEVRWFFDGALAETGAGVEHWFERRAPLGAKGRVGALQWAPAPPAWRDDRYLLVPGASDMGVKWREGQLQIKGRQARLGPRRFADGIEGEVERWVKWSYAGPAIERRFRHCFAGDAIGVGAVSGAPGASAAGGAPGVILLEKRRIQRLVRLKASGAAVEVPAGERCKRALSLELVRIRLAGRESHWSIGVEALPGDGAMDEPFTAVVADFLRGCPALPLERDRSLSYPAWLARLDLESAASDPS